MKSNYLSYFVSFYVVSVVVGWLAVGGIHNGGFELSQQPEPNWLEPPVYPAFWDSSNYVSLHKGVFDPPYDPNSGGQDVSWVVSGPRQGQRYVVLSTGDMGPDSDALIKTGSARQRIYLSSGAMISGSYFFGTLDYRPFEDNASIYLAPDPNTPNHKIILAQSSVSVVGSFGSTGGWIPFSRTIKDQEAGFYDLVLQVSDGGSDQIIKSYLAVDGLRMCSSGQVPGDINVDCSVNLLDMSIFASQWLRTCPQEPNVPAEPNLPQDPNSPTDPNCFCLKADFNHNYTVDPNDLMVIEDHWLDKETE